MLTVLASPSWSHAVATARQTSLTELFTSDPDRGATMMLEAGSLLIDVSRQHIDRQVLDMLIAAAGECRVQDRVAAMTAGEPINVSEHRAVGHIALRMRPDETFNVNGIDVVAAVHTTLSTMVEFANGVRTGRLTGATGRSFSHVVNIGIGGSDLGPRLVHEALWYLGHERITCRFVANVDPDDLTSQLADLDAAETLFIVSSKSFTTTETLMNARAAAEWLHRHLGEDAVAQHMVAVSADGQAVRASGLGLERVFEFWDWVGGRFSVGSAVGLAAMIAIGPEAFQDVLAGMKELDEHILGVEAAHNAPLILALIGVWNQVVLRYPTRAVIPYAFGLRRLPGYLQQLMMESNGKNVRSDGSPVDSVTSPIVWGDTGTPAQHAFMQLLHQGTIVVPVDFIGFATSAGSPGSRSSQRALFMNMVAQAQSLAFGRTHRPSSGTEEPHRTFAGNRPSTVITAPELSPRTLGNIIALYEHVVLYEGALLGLNSFDQWGVELGKEMASELLSGSGPAHENIVEGGAPTDHTTVPQRAGQRLVEWFESHQELPAE